MLRRGKDDTEEVGRLTLMKEDKINAEKVESQHRRGGKVNDNEGRQNQRREGKKPMPNRRVGKFQ